MKPLTRWIIGSVVIIFGYMAWVVVDAFRSYAQQRPQEASVSKYYHFTRCPACHLEKQPPDECGEFTGWLWEECQDLVHRYPDGDRQ